MIGSFKGALRKSVESAIEVVRREVQEANGEQESSPGAPENGTRQANKRPRIDDIPDVMNAGMRERLKKRAAANRESKRQTRSEKRRVVVGVRA